MAHVTLNTDAGVLHRIAAAVDGVGRAIATAIVVNSSAEARLREVQRLQGLSEAELSEIGVSRDRIVHHVFRDIYMI